MSDWPRRSGQETSGGLNSELVLARHVICWKKGHTSLFNLINSYFRVKHK